MKAVPPCDVVTLNLIRVAVLVHTNRRPGPIYIVKRYFAAFETYIPSICQAKGNQILHHFVLSIDGHVLAREFHERNSVQQAIRSQVDAFMAQAFAVETVAGARLAQHLNTGVFQHPGPDSLLAVIAGLCFENDGADAFEVKQVRKHQAGRPRSYDPYLGLKAAHRFPGGILLLQHGRLRLLREHHNIWRNEAALPGSPRRSPRCWRPHEDAAAIRRPDSVPPSIRL